jgi:hypothetical protein
MIKEVHRIYDRSLFRDPYGRLYFDKCATPQEHLLAPLQEGEERRSCRVYLEDLFTNFIGPQHAVYITIVAEEPGK